MDLLKECADMSVTADDGTAIPCCRFVVLKHSPVLRSLLEAVDKDMTVVPVPGMTASELRNAIQTIHGIISPTTMTLPTVTAAMKGLDYLGCDELTHTLAERCWYLVKTSKDLKILGSHAETVLRYNNNARAAEFLATTIPLAPLWEAQRAFLEEAVHLDADLAIALASALVQFYPPHTVLTGLLDMLPRAAMTLPVVVRLLGIDGAGDYFHPSETEELLDAVLSWASAKRWDDPWLGVLRTLRDAQRRCRAAPAVVSRIHGSVIEFEGSPTVSAYLRFSSPVNRIRTLTVAPWLFVEMHPYPGALSVCLTPSQLDDIPRHRRSLQMRITGTRRGIQPDAEVWYSWQFPNVGPHTMLRLTNAAHVLGDVDRLVDVVQCPALHSLRFDLFYSDKNVLEHPFV